MKKLLELFKNPPILFVFIFWFISLGLIAACTVMCVMGHFSYALYILGGLCLLAIVYSVFLIVKFVPTLRTNVKTLAKRHTWTDKLINNYGFRTAVFSMGSLMITCAFSFYNIILSYVLSSIWYGAIAGYYISISLVRLSVFISERRAMKRNNGVMLYREKLFIYRNSGIALLILETALTAAVGQMVSSPRPINFYSEITAISFAAFAVYKVSLAIYNTVKAHKLNDPIIQSHRNIGLTGAAVSLLSMQVTLHAVFGKDPAFAMILNSITGSAVCFFTIVLGISMIVKGTMRMNEIDRNVLSDKNLKKVKLSKEIIEVLADGNGEIKTSDGDEMAT